MPYASHEEKTEYQKRYMRLKRMKEGGEIPKYAFLKDLRALVFEKYGSTCSICRIDIPQVLTIHHVDGNHEDNRIDNLQLLCFNCHWMVENHPDKLHMIEDWTRRPIDLGLLRMVEQAIQGGKKLGTKFCVFHEDRLSIVTIAYDLETGLGLPEGRNFGLCDECWGVVSEKRPLKIESK